VNAVAAGALSVIVPEWLAPTRVHAAFTLRTGGVSQQPYDSLNFGAHVGDDAVAVRENRRRLRESLRLPSEPIWLQQVHGTAVVDMDSLEHVDALAAEPPRGDAAVARDSGRVCVIQVADCMPVLFAARDGSAVGAAHAGWRGLAAGVLEETVRKLHAPPSSLLAWLGPTIGQGHFEVGEDVRAAFMSTDTQAASAFTANARGRWQCDLYALARRRLAALGIQDISGGGWCTYADSARFFSFRRDGQCGRMAALIWLE
jgi:YfiH family protein